MTTAQRKAVADGYGFTGCYVHSFKKDDLKLDAAKYRAEGYRVRTVSSDGGYSLYVKDTEKTLEAAKVQAATDEVKRQELASEVIGYLAGLSDQIRNLSTRQLQNLKYEIDGVIKTN